MGLNPGTARPTDGSPPPLDPEAVELGEKIRALRTAAGLTLDAVAKTVGVSRSLISQVERGKASPSITTLRGIASTFGVPVAALFMGVDGMDSEDADSDRSGRRVVVRRHDRKRLLARRSGVYYELLTPDVSRKVEFLWGELDAGASAPTDPGSYAAHQGEENVICLEGEMTFEIDGKQFVLRDGDSISFDCSVPHRVTNTGRTKATMIVAITPPSF